jgi:hypothetical protein
MHRAGAAFGDPAAVFGAGQADNVADCPKKRHVAVDVERSLLPAYLDGIGHGARRSIGNLFRGSCIE